MAGAERAGAAPNDMEKELTCSVSATSGFCGVAEVGAVWRKAAVGCRNLGGRDDEGLIRRTLGLAKPTGIHIRVAPTPRP